MATDRTPIHCQIRDRLRIEILRDFKRGDRFGSQNELARRFGVSTLTVREAVSALVQEGLLERRLGSGTYVAQARSRTHVAILSELDVNRPETSPFFVHVVLRMLDLLRRQGFDARPYIGSTSAGGGAQDGKQRHAVDQLIPEIERGQVGGLIILATPVSAPLLACLRRHEVPFCADGEPWDCPVFGPFQVELLARGAAALAEAGCRRVACLYHGEFQNVAWARRVREVLTQAGLETPAGWQRHAFVGRGTEALDAFRAVWQSAAAKPDGLLVLDDVLYRSIAPMLLVNGIRVPDDLVVVAHANAGDPQPMTPAPIRLEIDPDRCAATCVESLVLRMAGGTPPVSRRVDISISHPHLTHSHLMLA